MTVKVIWKILDLKEGYKIIKNMCLNIVFLLLLSFLTACQTVTIRPKGNQYQKNSKADYEQVHNFFLWGLIGEKYINISAICPGRTIRQIRTQSGFWNRVIFIVTLGVYSPRTARVWCGDRAKRCQDYLKYDRTDPQPGNVIHLEMSENPSIDPEALESDIEDIKANDSQLPQYEEPE